MSNVFELQAEVRSDYGTSASRRMRAKDNKVPAIIYGAGQSPEPITLCHDAIIVALQQEAFYSHILSVKLNDKSQNVILKDLQRHPYKRKVLHLDFLRVKADEDITMNVPLHFKGEEDAPGLTAGGAVSHHITDLQIRCLPKNLPEFIEVDISKMELDAVLHLSDLKLPSGVESVALSLSEDHDGPVVSIHIPKVIKEPEPETTEVKADAETAADDGDAEKDEKSEKNAAAEKSKDNTKDSK